MSAPRPDYLRDTPRFDRSHIGMHWTDQWRFQAVDLFCGHGGVGRAFQQAPAPLDAWTFAGFDIDDHSETYPGRFGQADLYDPPSLVALGERVDYPGGQGYRTLYADRGRLADDDPGLPSAKGLTADVVWASPMCNPYSSLAPTYYGSQEAALEANDRITDDLRELCLSIAPHYIIENVPRATYVGDLHANVRVNGLAFGLPFDLERHFETTFECPDAYLDGEPEIVVDTREDQYQSVKDLAEAKGVPAEWGKQAVRSAIPWEYVYWVLHHCPAFPGPAPKRVYQQLAPRMATALGVDESLPGGEQA